MMEDRATRRPRDLFHKPVVATRVRVLTPPGAGFASFL